MIYNPNPDQYTLSNNVTSYLRKINPTTLIKGSAEPLTGN